MWERMAYFSKQYLALKTMWLRNSGGGPILLEVLKSVLLHEANESWSGPREREAPAPGLPKGHMFAKVGDDHSEGLYLIRKWARIHGRRFEG